MSSDSKAIELVMRLLSVRGPSCEENLVADAIVAELAKAGVDRSLVQFDTAHKRTPRPGNVGNLIIKLPGNVKRPRIMLSAHMDTVPICIGAKPKRTGKTIASADKQTGLGADDRAGVAVALHAVLETLASGEPMPPVTLCFFIQEEIGLQGSRQLSANKLGKISAAYNFDGSNPLKLTVGATGGERMKIVLRGLAAHAGLAPAEGASAITAAALAITQLHNEGWLGAVKKKGRVGTSNVGVIRGGNATNVVCDYVEVEAEARSHDAAFRNDIATAIEKAFIGAAAKTCSASGVAVTAEVARRVDYDSFRLHDDDPVVQAAVAAIESLGSKATLAVTNGGVDANWLVKHGIPTVTLGCGQRNVHTTSEMLDIPDFLMACRIARQLIQHAAR